jgi:hypothetical protein
MNKQLHTTLHKQRGLTMISWLIVIAFLLFQGILAMNIIPVYINDSSVSTMMKGLKTDTSLVDADGKKLRESIEKRLRINNVYSIEKENIKIKKTKTGYKVTIEYEPRGKLIGNLDYIASFKHEALLNSRATATDEE